MTYRFVKKENLDIEVIIPSEGYSELISRVKDLATVIGGVASD